VTVFVGEPSRGGFASRFVFGVRRTLSAEELSGDVEGLAADNDNLLATKQLLSDDGRQATQKVALAIDDDLEERERVVSISSS
jgi:hypothetical protein